MGRGCQDGGDGSDKQSNGPAAEEEMTAIGAGHGAFIEGLKESGELIVTRALADPSQAAVVTVRNGQPAVTDGPLDA